MGILHTVNSGFPCLRPFQPECSILMLKYDVLEYAPPYHILYTCYIYTHIYMYIYTYIYMYMITYRNHIRILMFMWSLGPLLEEVTQIPPGFSSIAYTSNTEYAAVEDQARRRRGVFQEAPSSDSGMHGLT